MGSANGRHRRPRQAPAIIVAAGVTGSAIAIPLLGAAGAHAADASTWDRVAECESGGMWSADLGNGYYGGLQFSQEVWKSYGGESYAERADLASRSQQIAVAEKVLDDQGPKAWPSCAVISGLAVDTGLPGVDPGSTPSGDPTGSADPSAGSDPSGDATASDDASSDATKPADGATDEAEDKGGKPDASASPSATPSTAPSGDASGAEEDPSGGRRRPASTGALRRPRRPGGAATAVTGTRGGTPRVVTVTHATAVPRLLTVRTPCEPATTSGPLLMHRSCPAAGPSCTRPTRRKSAPIPTSSCLARASISA